LIEKQARVEGFLVFRFAERYPEGLRQIRIRKGLAAGIESAPQGFIGTVQGQYTGKQRVKVAEVT
jgi:NADPH-dependent curcumin reductase CurA